MRIQRDIIWDIETEGAADEEFVRAITPPYPEFDADGVKTGDCKTDEAKAAKVERARQAHADQEEKYWAEKMEKRALRPETGRILTIGYLRADQPTEKAILDDADLDETRLLRRFWNVFQRTRSEGGKIIGWNSGGGMTCGFDLAYCIKRSWILGVPVPSGVTKGRFVCDTFVDLMQQWTLFGFKEFAKLDHCARVLGLGNKTEQEVCGATFAAWYRSGGQKKEKAVYYGKLDLVLTRDIYLRLNGLTLDGHGNAEESHSEAPPLENCSV